MDDDYTEVKTFEQATNDRLDAIEKEIKLIKNQLIQINKRVTGLSYSDSLHHGVYR